MKAISKFTRLSQMNRSFLIKLLLLIWAIRLGLWLLPFRVLRHLADRAAKRPTRPNNTGWPSPDQIAGSVILVSRYVPLATCLTQALATQVLLGRYGHPATLCIGVARSQGGDFEAHAWIESAEAVVIGGSKSELKQYTLLLTGEEKGL